MRALPWQSQQPLSHRSLWRNPPSSPLLAVMYLLFPQPLFTGPTAVRPLTPDAFKSLVEEGPADVAWLVRCGRAGVGRGAVR